MKSSSAILFAITALIVSGLFFWWLKGRSHVGGVASVPLSGYESPREEEPEVPDMVDDAVPAAAPVVKSEVEAPAAKEDGRRADAEVAEKHEVKPEEVEIKVAEKAEGANGRHVEFGEFVVDAGLHRNKTVKVHFGIALDAAGNPVPEASNIVFFAPYYPERGFIRKPQFRWYPEKAGYTIFSMDINSDLSEVEIRDKMYYYKESGFHDLVFEIQDILEKKYKLSHKKLLITGQSSGATMAEQLGCHYPDRIDAVAVSGGHRFDLIQKGNKVAWLSLLTAGDRYRYKAQFGLMRLSGGVGVQVLHTLMHPVWQRKGGKYFHHEASLDDWKMLQLFITGIVGLRDRNNGVVPDYHRWPEKSRYDGKVWYYPSKEFADAWKKLPHEAILELAYYKEHLEEPVYFIPESPKSVVVYIHDNAVSSDEVQLIDNLYFIMGQGAVAATVRMSDDYFATEKNIERLLKAIQRRPEWRKLPIYVVGVGAGGQLAAVAALKTGERIEKKRVTKTYGKGKIIKTVIVRHTRIRKITTINSPYRWPFAKLSVLYARWKYKAHIPLVMLFSKDYTGEIPHGSKYREVKKVDVGGMTLGPRWFDTIKESMK